MNSLLNELAMEREGREKKRRKVVFNTSSQPSRGNSPSHTPLAVPLSPTPTPPLESMDAGPMQTSNRPHRCRGTTGTRLAIQDPVKAWACRTCTMLNEGLTVIRHAKMLQEVGVCKICNKQTVFVETFLGHDNDGWVRMTVVEKKDEPAQGRDRYQVAQLRSEIVLASEAQLNRNGKPQLKGSQLMEICTSFSRGGATSSGKWLVSVNRIEGAEAKKKWQQKWDQVKYLLRLGKIGGACKITPFEFCLEQGGQGIICIYTRNFADQKDVTRSLQSLHEANIFSLNNYKADIVTVGVGSSKGDRPPGWKVPVTFWCASPKTCNLKESSEEPRFRKCICEAGPLLSSNKLMPVGDLSRWK